MRVKFILGHSMAHDGKGEEGRRPEAKALSSCPLGVGRGVGCFCPQQVTFSIATGSSCALSSRLQIFLCFVSFFFFLSKILLSVTLTYIQLANHLDIVLPGPRFLL